jgi:hypothetical protein
MTFSAFEPYGLFVTELYQKAISSDCALRASVALRRARNRALNAVFARILAAGPQAPRARAFIADTLAR